MNDSYMNIIKYYCYPNEKYPRTKYEVSLSEHKELFLKAAAEFIENVRLREKHPIETWSNHEERWNYHLKNNL